MQGFVGGAQKSSLAASISGKKERHLSMSGAKDGIQTTPKTFDMNPLNINRSRSPYEASLGMTGSQQLYDYQMQLRESQILRGDVLNSARESQMNNLRQSFMPVGNMTLRNPIMEENLRQSIAFSQAGLGMTQNMESM